MFKGIFGSKEKKTTESYVPPSVASFETTVAADASVGDSPASAFGFMSSDSTPNSAASPSSAFGFISSTPDVASVPASNPSSSFAFIQDAAPDSSSVSSGFSFITDNSTAQSAPISSGFSFIQDAPAAPGGGADVDPKILEENMRVAGLKKVVKKRSMARKPGQAAHDDDDAPANSAQKPMQPPVADANSAQKPMQPPVADANSAQKPMQPPVADAGRPSASVELSNTAAPPVGSSTSALPSLHEHQQPEEPSFSFISQPAAAQPSTSPSSAPPVNEHVIPSIQDDSDGDNSDGGGLDLDGMIIHDVAPEVLPPPVHQQQQQQQQQQPSQSYLQDWVELKDEASGKLCVSFVLQRLFERSNTNSMQLYLTIFFSVTTKITRLKSRPGKRPLVGPAQHACSRPPPPCSKPPRNNRTLPLLPRLTLCKMRRRRQQRLRVLLRKYCQTALPPAIAAALFLRPNPFALLQGTVCSFSTASSPKAI